MFRCITELRGLVIDLESFSGMNVSRWRRLNQQFKCLFLISDHAKEQQIRDLYPEAPIYYMEDYLRLFAPSPVSHAEVIKRLNMKATELVYISRDHEFLSHAMNFLGGTIWVTESANYEEASAVADLVCKNIDEVESLLSNHVYGFWGEIALFPGPMSEGMVLPVELKTPQGIVPLYMLGRYFGKSHYMAELHPYSAAISLNKKRGKKYYGVFNDDFARLYTSVVQQIQNQVHIDGILAVPARPGEDDRFEQMLAKISKTCRIKNLGERFMCVSDYPSQKGLSSSERQENIKGVFSYNGDLSGQNIIIIDDIVTTGATIRESIDEIFAHEASQIFAITLGVNQMQGAYWYAEPAQVLCPNCGSIMHLLVNSNTKEFFYSCYNCRGTLGFDYGRKILIDSVNSEMSKY